MRIVYVLSSRHGLDLSKHNRNMVNIFPDYNCLYWRPPDINGMHFAKLDSYDICGLSAMIYRTVPHHQIRYILGTTGAGCLRLRGHGDQPLSSWDNVFIENDKLVRPWLLSNQVLNDPLEMMVYCYHDQLARTQNTGPLTRVNYLAQDGVRHWAHYPGAQIGYMHIRLGEI